MTIKNQINNDSNSYRIYKTFKSGRESSNNNYNQTAQFKRISLNPPDSKPKPDADLVASRREINELKEMQKNISSTLENMQETFLKKFVEL